MALVHPAHQQADVGEHAESVERTLVQAWRGYFEDPAGALADAVSCHEFARRVGDPSLRARALALQAAVSLHRGDLRSALALALEAERYAETSEGFAARAEVAAIKAQLSFFGGSYADALRHAELAVALSDASDDPDLRIFARRATCVVFGNVGVRNWEQRLGELLDLTVSSGDLWEEAISRNDLACSHHEAGDVDAAEHEIERALAVAHRVPTLNRFALAVIHSSRADIRLAAGRAADALADAEHAIALLTETDDPNPYVLGVTVRAQVQARMALGHHDDAQQAGEGALAWLGDNVPQTRSLILSTLADALRDAGHVEEAYDALARAAELERQAFRELSELQLSLERTTLEVSAARRETESLAVKNRELADAHAELERRTQQLEQLQEKLRDQAERDWLTGLHNRRFLAQELDRLSRDQQAGPLSLAVLDLDHFKSINDRFGHDTGDQVLVRIAGLLCDVLRDTDIVVRSGGEEFIFLMPGADERAGLACCERIRQAVTGESWDGIVGGLEVTTSIGVAAMQAPGDLEALVRLADRRLYEAKHAGRNRVVGTPGV
jgi:diguanylate cyclase (GGDEF)-like protein